MRYRKLMAGLLASLLLLSASAGAATCRAGSAAQAGSQTGYERARTAAESWASRENDVSSSLQSCLSRIKKITLTLPQFPSLEQILARLEDEVCSAVVDKVNDNLPGNIDPWKNYSD